MCLDVLTMLGTWAAGVGSIAAACAALWVSHKADVRRDLERDDELEGQARLIHSSIVKAQPTFKLSVHNGSEAPITAVEVVGLYLKDEHGISCDLPSWSSAGLRWAWIGAGGTASAMTTVSLNGEHVPLVDRGWSVTADIEFVDARGIRWRRWSTVRPRRSPVTAVHREPIDNPPAQDGPSTR